MSPSQEAATRAKIEVFAHVEDFRAAGVQITQDQANLASDLASRKVEAEYKEKEGQDPIRQIATTLEASAQTDEEKLFVQQQVQDMEETRSKWIDLFNKTRYKIKVKSGNTNPTVEEIMEEQRYNYNLPSMTSRSDNGKIDFVFNILNSVQGRAKEAIFSSPNFTERVLRRLGALEEKQEIDSLNALPIKDIADVNSGVYQYSDGSIHGLTTSIDGVVLNLHDKERHPYVFARFTKENFLKIINFPKS